MSWLLFEPYYLLDLFYRAAILFLLFMIWQELKRRP